MFDAAQLKKFYGYCLSLTKDPEDAKDLLHTGVEKWLLADMDEIRAPKSYFFRILKNTFIDQLRSKGRKQTTSLDDVEESKIISLETQGLEDFICDKDEVYWLLESLGSKDRELLYLWAVEGFTFQEISEMTDTPRGSLLARMHRMKKKLADKRDKIGFEVRP